MHVNIQSKAKHALVAAAAVVIMQFIPNNANFADNPPISSIITHIICTLPPIIYSLPTLSREYSTSSDESDEDKWHRSPASIPSPSPRLKRRRFEIFNQHNASNEVAKTTELSVPEG